MTAFRITTLLIACSSILVGAPHSAKAAKRGAAPEFTQVEREYWAFQPVKRPSVPKVKDQSRVRTPIDAFLLNRLEEAGLEFSPPAGRRELLRRVKYDLLGLPPTPEEVDRFLQDDSPGAYERLIDELLASPHYGERWGRHWLDLVRYSETAGFNADPTRPLAYKYRDYVIRAFNNNTPYDRFIQEQLAGDELFPGRSEALVATGYNRLWPDESNASNVLLARQDGLNDLTANVGAVFLGLSIGCAQCHDHKFDPILQTDFYQLQAFFVGLVPQDRVPIAPADQLADYQQKLQQWMADTEAVRRELHELEQTARVKASHIKRLKFPAIVLDAIDTAEEHRSAFQHQLAFWSERQIEVDEKQLLAQLSDEQQQRREELQQQLKDLKKSKPQPPSAQSIMASVEIEDSMPPTHLLAGGSYNKPLQELQPGFLQIVRPDESNLATIEPPRPGTSGRRTALARWMTDPENPLTARVMVNRLWQEHFGQGLVSNANDFGVQTPPPSHPELLDWLAAEFVSQGWDVKAMHRLMVTSAAYRQAAHQRTADDEPLTAETVDPGNELYWHYPRRRLTAENIRDALLAVAGLLERGMYGPGVRPQMPPNFSSRERWDESKDEADRHRRSVYIFAKRNLPYPLLDVFDLPDMHESCAKRSETTVAPQALMLLNSEMILDYARKFAGRLIEENPSRDLPPLVEAAYLRCFTRKPDAAEIAAAIAFIERQKTLVVDGQTTGDEPDHGLADLPESFDPALAAAFVDFCHALLNANEFVYLD
jgi:hypothetical protein